MRFHTTLWIPDLSTYDNIRLNTTLQDLDRAAWAAQDALAEWRDHAHNLEAREQAGLERERVLMDRIKRLEDYIKRLEEAERGLRASNARMVPEGRRLEQRERDLVAHIDDKLLPYIKTVEGRERDSKGHIDGKLLPRIKVLEKRERELVEKVNAYAKRINDDLIPKVTVLQQSQKAMQEEATRASEREKALEARVAALTEENERLCAAWASTRHELADAEDAGRALRDEVDSLERDAYERQQEAGPAPVAGP